MNKNNKTIIIIAVAALAVIALCLGTLVVGGITAYTLLPRDEILQQPILEPIVDDPIEQPPQIEPETPLGAEIDLADLFSPFWESWELLHENYVDQPIDDQLLADGAFEGLYLEFENAGIDLDLLEVPDGADTAEYLAREANTPEEVMEDFLPFWEAWQKAEYAELDSSLTYELLMQNSLRYMVAALGDPHTSYMDPDDYRQSQIGLEGEYEGIGAWVDPSAEYLTIIAPMEGSPAEAAGLLPGDQIIAIDGEDMSGIDGDLVIRRVLGPAGSTVVLTIAREGVEPFDVEITRARIVIPTVETEILEGNIAYIQLYNFGADSSEEMHIALAEIMEQDPVGIILDLRNNGGGYLHAAVNITSEFVDEGIVLYEEYGDGSRDTYEIRPGGLATDIPLVILINGGTASASEILAGVVQDYGRGTLVGTTSFGKGSVQLPLTLSDSRGALRITIARWLTPLERHIQDLGIEPDIFIEITQLDVDSGNDPQLERAIEILTSQ